MRKFFLYIIMMASIMSSCEKLDILDESYNNTKVSGDGDYVLSVISGINPMTRSSISGSGMSEYVTRISYAIFDDHGNRIKNTYTQIPEDDDFGKFKVRLDAGNYILILLAYSGEGNCTISGPEKVTFKNSQVSETFMYYDTIKVTSDKELTLSLKRVTSTIKICSSSSHPSGVSRIKFYYTGGSSTLNPSTGLGCVKSRQTSYRDVNDQETYNLYTFPYMKDSVSLDMTAYLLDTSGEEYDDIHIPSNIPAVSNKITIVNYSLYDRSTSFGDISINTEWGETITVNIP